MKKKIITALVSLKDLFISAVSLLLSLLIKRDDNWIAFGSWCGELYIDNSRYLLEYINRNNPESQYHLVWVGEAHIRDELPEGVQFVQINSFRSILVLLKCKYMFFVQMHRADICKYNVYRKAVLCYLDHGIGLKKWAMDAPGYHGELEKKNFHFLPRLFFTVMGEFLTYDYIVSAGELHKKNYQSALRYRASEDTEFLVTGTPRNDFLVHGTSEEAMHLKKKYASLLGFDTDKRVIIYLPTFRRLVDEVQSFSNRDVHEMQRLEEMLRSHNAVLLEKNHFVANKFACNSHPYTSSEVVKIQTQVNVQELLLFADIQISDYSGCILDYLLMDRPIIHFAYDLEQYRAKDSGLYFPIDDFAAGKVAQTFDEVVAELDDLLSGVDRYCAQRAYVKAKYIPAEDGNASKRIFETVIRREKP